MKHGPALPSDVQGGLQVAHMEVLQLLQVSPLQSPCLTTIEEAGKNDRPAHLALRGPPDVVLAQNTSLQVAKSLAGLADPGADSLSRLLITLPRYLKSSTVFSWVPLIEMVGSLATAAGAG